MFDLLKEIAEFEDWLSPEVMKLLINAYAVKDPEYGTLKWEYKKMPGRLWGSFHAAGPILYVNDSKTKGLFKQQVETILHEIQHWNQFVDTTTGPKYQSNWGVGSIEGASEEDQIRWKKNDKKVRVRVWDQMYQSEKRRYGYLHCPSEMGARDFASEHLDEAMKMLGEQHYGTGKVEGGTLDEVVEELMEEYVDGGEKPLTRLQIGTVLRTYDLNNAANMSKVIADLKELGIKVA